MNVLFKMSPDKEHQDFFIYCLLCSDAAKDGKKIRCRFNVNYLYEKFRDSDLKVSRILKRLSSTGKIKLSPNGDIYVGTVSKEGIVAVYGDIEAKDKLGLMLDNLNNLKTHYLDNCSIKYRQEGLSAYEQAEEIIELDSEDITSTELASFFRCVYFLCFHEDHRKFMGKEYGQIKGLLRLFSPEDCLLIINEYLVNSDEYVKGKASVSLGLLLYHKDNIFARIRGSKNKAKSNERHRTKVSDKLNEF